MNATKNELLVALNYLGEFPKETLKKQELMEKLNEIYDGNQEQLAIVINTEIYDLIKKLVKADKNGIDVEKEYESEVEFLQGALIIEEPIITNQKIHIKFNEGMEEKLSKFINNRDQEVINKNQVIIDIMINILDVYGMIQDYEMLYMLNKFLKMNMSMEIVLGLVNYQIDLRNEIVIGEAEDEDEIYFMNNLVDHPEDIVYEKESRNLDYKEYTLQELEKYSYENIIDCKEAQEVLKFLKKKKIEYAEELTMTMILHFMCEPKLDLNDFRKLIKIDFEDINEGNEYLQVIMNLHNNVPHYALYGYSPNELFKIQIEKQKKAEEKRKKRK